MRSLSPLSWLANSQGAPQDRRRNCRWHRHGIGLREIEMAGAGYINARINRAEVAFRSRRRSATKGRGTAGKVLVEHSSSTQQAAQSDISEMRFWAIRSSDCLRFAGRGSGRTDYIDNTGVQVADVAVGFLHIEKKTRAEIEALAAAPRFDFYCWDLYARASQWYAQDKQKLQLGRQLSMRLKRGITKRRPSLICFRSPCCDAILRPCWARHRLRLSFLPRESEILRLWLFWDAVYETQKAGVLGARLGQKLRLLGDAPALNVKTLTHGVEATEEAIIQREARK